MAVKWASPSQQVGFTCGDSVDVRILADYAVTRHLSLSSLTAVQIFIAADALDVTGARVQAEKYLGAEMLRPEKETFLGFLRMSRLFHMEILETFLDSLCLDHFGWFCTSLPLLSPQYLAAWPLDKLSSFLAQQRFGNCSEEQVFTAVVNYCRTRSDKESWDELAPGLYKSCGAYLSQCLGCSLTRWPPGSEQCQ